MILEYGMDRPEYLFRDSEFIKNNEILRPLARCTQRGKQKED
jgi:hypothetical protein